jgi:hypothetical protein
LSGVVEAVTDAGELIKFGKDEERARPPKTDYRIAGIG